MADFDFKFLEDELERIAEERRVLVEQLRAFIAEVRERFPDELFEAIQKLDY